MLQEEPNKMQPSHTAAGQSPAPRPAVKACLWCGASEKRLKCCSGCGTVWLCGKDCQQQLWPSHKAACKDAQRCARLRAAAHAENSSDSQQNK
ncbi:hypothetical protein DUNSADRAFT_8936 [Dunaliella salina]|uniref:MYND-type domain-containing protein n=1 Tax=Dunaliella salina TaxID=3046 RepID=A0ABQ7GIG4_DUNSA|nr:hypothetical protein DUNSADRAFT_8936 [Dunaliella salina]|eukprot:KAF5834406.1 hypothetical protein DUNSADRAFT_8936 [Dunaliella salina]